MPGSCITKEDALTPTRSLPEQGHRQTSAARLSYCPSSPMAWTGQSPCARVASSASSGVSGWRTTVACPSSFSANMSGAVDVHSPQPMHEASTYHRPFALPGSLVALSAIRISFAEKPAVGISISLYKILKRRRLTVTMVTKLLREVKKKDCPTSWAVPRSTNA